MMSEIDKRSEKITRWLKNPYNLILVAILIFTFFVRTYHFGLTQNQALWWDEAEYMSTAKKWAFDVPYDLNPQRPPLFQALAALSFIFGLGELFIKYAFVLLPSIFLVFAIYLLGREMFDEKIGLIAAFLSSVSWTLLFWTSRVQPDFLSMSFQVLSILLMWKYWKSENKLKLGIFAGIFAALGFLFKVSGLLVPMIFVVFILMKERLAAFKNKGNYYFAISFLLTLAPYFIWSYLNFGTPFGFRQGYSNALLYPTPFAWNVINYFPAIAESFLFYIFLLGLILSLKFLIYSDILLKEKKRCFDPNIFSFLALIIVSAFYIFYIRAIEDRWVFLWLPFIFFIIGHALIFAYDNIKKYSKILGVVVVLTILAFAGYNQVLHANSLIKDKLPSYLPVKEAGIWIKDNSNKEDKLLSISYTQSTYYSERNTTNYGEKLNSAEEFDVYLENNKPRFLQVSMFEPHPQWIFDWTQKNQNKLAPLQVYYADSSKQQAALVIYEIK